jgi:glycosyltransferase involved in cell wall biosynthesis
MSVPISVLFITRNEEARLPYALRSVKSWAAEIVVVDMHSEDRTREIAEAAGARVLLHEAVGYVEPARAWGVAQCREDWILALDADEVVPAPLARRLAQIVARDEADVVELPYANYLVGREMGHTGWGPHQDRHVRFFKRGQVRFGERIHEKLSAARGARVLRLPATASERILHFNYVDLEHFLDKLNRYTSIEAREARARGERCGVLGSLWGAVRRFLGKYLRRSGWRDGWLGFVLSAYQGFYEFAARTKQMAMQRAGSREEIEARYREIAERILRDYEQEDGSGEGSSGSGSSAASRVDSASPKSNQCTQSLG